MDLRPSSVNRRMPRNIPAPRVRRSGVRWLLVAVALVAAVESLRAGVADFLRLQPCTYLDHVQRAGARPDPAILGAARDRLELARTVDPGNPVIHEYLAIVYFHRAHLVAGDPALRRGYLESARTYYEAALALRPHSGYLWAGIMAVHAALLQAQPSGGVAGAAEHVDEDGLGHLGVALRHALRLAPWEPQVLKAVATTGRLHYAALGSVERDMVDEARRRLTRLGP